MENGTTRTNPGKPFCETDRWRGQTICSDGHLVYSYDPHSAETAIFNEAIQFCHETRDDEAEHPQKLPEINNRVPKLTARAKELLRKNFHLMMDAAVECFPRIAFALAVMEEDASRGKKMLREALAWKSKEQWEMRGFVTFHDPEPTEKDPEDASQAIAKASQEAVKKPAGKRGSTFEQQKYPHRKVFMERHVGKAGGRRPHATRWTPDERHRWAELAQLRISIIKDFKRTRTLPPGIMLPATLKREALTKNRFRARDKTPQAIAFEWARQDLKLPPIERSTMEKYYAATKSTTKSK